MFFKEKITKYYGIAVVEIQLNPFYLRHRSGEVDAGQVWWSSDCIAKDRSISWNKVDYTGWYAGLSHYIEYDPIR